MSNYFIRFTEPYDVELWSTVRLPFEPKGWVKQMRDELRSTLHKVRPEPNTVLECVYCSTDSRLFDVENVLLYNLGPSHFKHLCQDGLSFERSRQDLPEAPSSQYCGFQHYHRYRLVPRSSVSSESDESHTIAKWNDLICPPLTTDTRPHVLWSLMKQHPTRIGVKFWERNYAIDMVLTVPAHATVNAAALIKPLLDGIISAFHSHDGTDLPVVTARLSKLTGLSESTIAALLIDSETATLGQRRLVHPRAQGIQWNPADDLCCKVRVSIRYEHIQDWTLSGRLMQA